MPVHVGDLIEHTVTFRNPDTDALVDPATVAVTVRPPVGDEDTYTQADDELQHVGTGIYRIAVEATVPGSWKLRWLSTGDARAAEPADVWVEPTEFDTLTGLGVYATTTDLRDHLGVDSEHLSDREAAKHVAAAEDVIDRLLGSYYPDETTGRKIVEADVQAWQWEKLKRATVALAALFHANPSLLTEQRWNSVSGPDFSFAGPQGATVGAQVVALLDDSRLRRLATRANAGRRRSIRPEYERFLKATRHNGT